VINEVIKTQKDKYFTPRWRVEKYIHKIFINNINKMINGHINRSGFLERRATNFKERGEESLQQCLCDEGWLRRRKG
jgi:hypothetical protein